MDIHPCNCPWDIPGIAALPDHHHYIHPVGLREDLHLAPVPDADLVRFDLQWAMEERVAIWVDWREVARELAKEVRDRRPV